MQVQYRWTDGNDEDFRRFYSKTEDYYSSLVGGIQNRQAFVPYNLSQAITDVIIAEAEGRAAGCAGLKEADIPSSVRTIDGTAFDGCEELRYIISHLPEITIYALEHNLIPVIGEYDEGGNG